MSEKIELVIPSRVRDLGGFQVRRILPYATHRMVGPFIFLDHMGPQHFRTGEGMDVRPHPHIGLATVTYLFAGSILHRDSLGSHQLIEPGAINWMVAGRGIAHSERMPQEARQHENDLHGLQCWVALPLEHEETEPSFTHHSSDSLPEFQVGDIRMKLLLGTAFGFESPVPTHSDIFYVDAVMPPDSKLILPSEGRELGIYLVDGHIQVEDDEFTESNLVVGKPGEDLILKAHRHSRVILLGGKALEGPRKIWWNFVSSSEERLEKAKRDWAEGRFPKIPGDDKEFIPLPADAFTKNPPGTIM
ncbi:pirin family protein [Bdellovibrio sp. HCB337]|uniref:pirin family protein n=1 Tax=Bdellovibrio sp. HCB337 TaxID=3394358 RepID=UPI0039A62C01